MAELDVALYMRKARATGNFSIEAIFARIEQELTRELRIARVEAPELSNGLAPRWRIARHAGKVDARVVHVTGDIQFAALAVPREKLVLTVHDCVFLRDETGPKRALLKALWLDLPVRRARVVTTVSSAIAAEIRRETGLALPNLQVVPNAVSDRFQPRPKRPSGGPLRLLQIGTAPNKNLARLVEAARGLDCVLTILGALDDALRAQLAAARLTYEAKDRVGEDELLALYEAADLVTFPSTYEGFGLPILEAQAIGRPILAGDIPVLRDVAGDGALFADPRDVRALRSALERLLSDGALRDELVARGARNVTRFTWRAVASQYLAIYRDILKS